MVTKKDVLTWLKSKDKSLAGCIYCGMINRNQDKSVGIYKRKNGKIQPLSVSGLSDYGYTAITLLIRWTANATQCEEKALALWEVLQNANEPEQIGGHTCWIFARSEPVDLGKDELNIFEAVIDFDILFQK